MYQNSVLVRGHAKKRLHKSKMAKSFLRSNYRHEYKSYGDYLANCPDVDTWCCGSDGKERRERYWRRLYLTGPRKYAKRTTNRVLRAKFRNSNRYIDVDATLPRYSQYRKYFD